MEISLPFLYSSPYFAMFTISVELVSLMNTDIGVLKSYADNIRYRAMEEFDKSIKCLNEYYKDMQLLSYKIN